jgi:hypothetical protein
MASVGIVMAAMFGAVAQAATVPLSCTPPTHFTDGTAINKPITYSFHWGTSATTLTGSNTPVTTCADNVVVPDPAAGSSQTYYFAARAIVDSVQSALTNVVSRTITIPKPTPNPPTGLRVIDTAAYRLDQGYKDQPRFKLAGSIPLGTPCHDVAQVTDVNGKTLQLSKRTVVTPIGTLPLVVYAKCG